MALSYAFIIGTIEGSVAKCTPKDHPAIENAWIALDNVHFRAKFGNIRWSSPGVRIVCSTDDVKERRTVFNKSHIITAGGTISNLLVNLWPEETLRGAFGEFGLISYIIHSRRSRCKAVDIDSKITKSVCYPGCSTKERTSTVGSHHLSQERQPHPWYP